MGASVVFAGFEHRSAPAAALPIYRTSILPPENVTLNAVSAAGGLALSPDGRRLVFTAFGADGRQMLWVRSLDGLSAQALAGTEFSYYPFWSPDSRSIGFYSGGKLKKIDVAGGSPVTLCDTSRSSNLAAGGTWNRDGTILFAQATVPIYKVSDMGGTPVPATTLDQNAGETQHWAPFFLPDGRHFLYFAAGSKTGGPDDPNGVYVGSLDSSDRKLLFPGGSNAKYADGFLIFPRDRVLVAQPFDLEQLTLKGDAVPIADQVSVGGLSGRTGAFSVSENGVLAFQSGYREIHTQLHWYDRKTKVSTPVGDQADYNDVELSPNREEAAVSVLDSSRRTRDIWLFDMDRGVRTRFTLDATDEDVSVWSPDGKHLVYNSRPQGLLRPLRTRRERHERADGAVERQGGEKPQQLVAGRQVAPVPTGSATSGNNDVWVLPMTGDAKPTPVPFLQSPFNERNARFSPDGRWVAYVSNETGNPEVFVTRFPGPSGKWPISAGGGDNPRWRADGRELYYIARNGMLMAATVNGTGADFDVKESQPVLQINRGTGTTYPYDVSADGQRFLVNTIVDSTALPPITLVVNWAGGAAEAMTTGAR